MALAKLAVCSSLQAVELCGAKLLNVYCKTPTPQWNAIPAQVASLMMRGKQGVEFHYRGGHAPFLTTCHSDTGYRWVNSFWGSFMTSTSSIMQAAGPRWKLCFFFLPIYRSPFTSQLPKEAWGWWQENDQQVFTSDSHQDTAICKPHSCYLPLSVHKLLSEHLMSPSSSPAEEQPTPP